MVIVFDFRINYFLLSLSERLVIALTRKPVHTNTHTLKIIIVFLGFFLFVCFFKKKDGPGL